MAVPYSNTKLRVPKGFQNILEGLAREVLRNQPTNIYEFGNLYFEQLLVVRQETGHDPALQGSRLEDRFYNNAAFKSPTIDSSDPQQQDAAVKIQTQFRQHAAKKEVEELEKEDAALKIQAGFRGYHDRQKVLEMKDPEEYKRHQEEIEKRQGKHQDQEEEIDIDLTDPEVEKAAVKIQAGFKGFKARQEVKDMKGKEKNDAKAKSKEPISQLDHSDPEINEAATKIQAGFRGHRSRKELKNIQQGVHAHGATSPTAISTAQKSEETVDVDLNDPSAGAAATKIQAGFRGHMVRKELKQKKSKESHQYQAQVEETTEKEEEEIDINLEDPEVEKAAVKIQAGFKGMKARQEVKAMKDKKEEKEEEKEKEKEEIDIDLNDPKTEEAAIKIQAGFKGYKTRQELKKKLDENQSQPEESGDYKAEQSEAVDIDLNDPEVELAATKIQAGFKGYKVRKEMKDSKVIPDAAGKQEEGPTEVFISIPPDKAEIMMEVLSAFQSFKRPKRLPDRLRLTKKTMKGVRQWLLKAQKLKGKKNFTSVTSLLASAPTIKKIREEVDEEEAKQQNINEDTEVDAEPTEEDYSNMDMMSQLDLGTKAPTFEIELPSTWVVHDTNEDESGAVAEIIEDSDNKSDDDIWNLFNPLIQTHLVAKPFNEGIANMTTEMVRDVLPTMLESISKNILYEPYKRGSTFYKTWLEENEETLLKDELERHKKIYNIMQKIVEELENWPDTATEEEKMHYRNRIQAWMQQAERLGDPPIEVLNEMNATAVEQDAAGILESMMEPLIQGMSDMFSELGSMFGSLAEGFSGSMEQQGSR